MSTFIVTREVNTNEYDAAGTPVRVREYMLATRNTEWTRNLDDSRIAKFATREIAVSVAFHATDVDLTDSKTIVEVAE